MEQSRSPGPEVFKPVFRGSDGVPPSPQIGAGNLPPLKIQAQAFGGRVQTLAVCWHVISQIMSDVFTNARRVLGMSGDGIGRTIFRRTEIWLRFVLLYLNFRLTLPMSNGMGRWDCPAACRRQDSGADEFVVLWHWSVTKCVGSQSRSCLCPKLEPLMERSRLCGTSSHLQE